MPLQIPQKEPAKVARSIRISPKAAEILDDLAEAYNTNHSLCIEALLNKYGSAAVADEKQKD